MRRGQTIDNPTRALIVEEIKKYPEIWDNRHRGAVKTEKWNDIADKFDLLPRKTRLLWSECRRHYYDILLRRAIERDTSPCGWHLFHHMSFIYEHIKVLIQESLGGIAPPLLEPGENQKSPCPCCIPVSKTSSINEPKGPTQCRIEGNNSSEAQNLDQGGSKPPIESSSRPIKIRRKSLYSGSKDRRSIERCNIIDAIRQYPVLYEKDVNIIPKCSLSFAWKSVAEQVGIPLMIIQNRWRLFKRRYVEELMRQRYSNGEFHSKWENFEQMSFMRDHMKAAIANIDKIRDEIQQIVEDQKGAQQTIDLCADEDEVIPIENEITDQGSYQESHPSQDVQSPLPVIEDQPFKEKSTNYDSKNEPETLTLISDEEDNNDKMSVVSLDDYEDTDLSLESEESDGVYEKEIVYFAESIKNDIICIDDDTDDE